MQLIAIGACMGAPAVFADLFDKTSVVRSMKELQEQLTKDSVVMYGGGEDIHPSLYNEPKLPQTYCGSAPSSRDLLEFHAVQLVRDKGAINYGICRGLQMIHVSLGGKLFQHVDNHNRDHRMFLRTSVVENSLHPWTDELKEFYENNPWGLGEDPYTTSAHHQLIDPTAGPEDLSILANASEAVHKIRSHNNNLTIGSREVEVAYYRMSNSIGVQGHPEFDYKDSPYQLYCRQLMKEIMYVHSQQH